jgi:non-ribosomal peptide synthetase component F
LPTDRARPAVQTFGAEACQVSLSAEQTAALKRLSQEHQATLYMTLLAAFGILLSRYSGQDDVVVGSPIANRQEPELEDLIGFFVNSVVMRIRLASGMTFGELVRQVRQTALEAYQHQYVPFERIVEELSPQRRLNTTPIYQISFTLNNVPWILPQLKGVVLEAVQAPEILVRFDMEIHAFELREQILLRWLYNRDLFDRWRVDQMAQHYVSILAAVANADKPTE